MNRTILVVDDEPKIVRLVESYLQAAGFRTVTAGNGPDALQQLHSENPDLIVLDLMLPELDGIEVTRAVRKVSDVPVIMLTARTEESDRLVGLEIGADDYVSKPFSPKELVARVRAVLRRATPESRTALRPGEEEGDAAPVTAGALILDPSRREARLTGKPIELTSYQFDLLYFLARHPGRVFNRMQLVEAVQDFAYEGYERTIDAHMKNLRRALSDDARNPRFIETVRSVGYRFIEQE